MKYAWTTIVVQDFDSSVQFYTEIVGLKVQRQFTTYDGSSFIFLGENEGTLIELIYRPDGQPLTSGDAISLGFAVESLDEMIAFVQERGITLLTDVIQPSKEIKFFYVLDPNGVKIQFSESM
jgi:lactoylglutathione lyase